MPKRQIIEIDRDKCNGCGLCTDACAEGALVLDDENKAVLAKEIFCDGLGACLDVCPVDALHIVERESEDYDPQEAYKHVLKTRGKDAAA
ncbi:MAG: 4Fe-4S binding protein, partial [Acidobacteria bacterium]|nr:4Fe-4S binding protein [Acidobacteriota bacterium]